MLISRWRLQVARERLWGLLLNPTEWPDWWPHLAGVERRAPGGDEGLGAEHAFRWRSGVGYELRVVMTTRRVERFRELEGTADGDLRGIGLWIIEDDAPDAVRLTYRWDVELRKPWQRCLTPLLRPLFAYRHFVVMRGGAKGMASRLGCRLSHVEEWSGITPLAENTRNG